MVRQSVLAYQSYIPPQVKVSVALTSPRVGRRWQDGVPKVGRGLFSWGRMT